MMNARTHIQSLVGILVILSLAVMVRPASAQIPGGSGIIVPPALQHHIGSDHDSAAASQFETSTTHHSVPSEADNSHANIEIETTSQS